MAEEKKLNLSAFQPEVPKDEPESIIKDEGSKLEIPVAEQDISANDDNTQESPESEPCVCEVTPEVPDDIDPVAAEAERLIAEGEKKPEVIQKKEKPKISLAAIKSEKKEEEVVEEEEEEEIILTEEEKRIQKLTSKVTIEMPDENVNEDKEYFTNYNKVEEKPEDEKSEDDKEDEKTKKKFTKKQWISFVALPGVAIMILCTGLFFFVQSEGEIPQQQANILEATQSGSISPEEQLEVLKNEIEEMNKGGYKILLETILNDDGTSSYLFNNQTFNSQEELNLAIKEHIEVLKIKKLKDYISQ